MRTITYKKDSIIDPNLIDWFDFCQRYLLTEDFIEKWIDYVNWSQISRFQKLTEGFIEKWKDYVDWTYIIKKQNLSCGFLDKYFDRLFSVVNTRGKHYLIDYIINHQKLEEWFIDKYFDRLIKTNYSYIGSFKEIELEDIIRTQKHLKFEYLKSLIDRNESNGITHILGTLLYYRKVPIEFLDKVLEKNNFDVIYTRTEFFNDIIKTQNVTTEFMKKYAE